MTTVQYIDAINDLTIEAPADQPMEQIIELALVRAMRNLHAIESELSFLIAAFNNDASEGTWPERILIAAKIRHDQLEQALHVLLGRMRTITSFETKQAESLIVMQ